jgi:hypothetical protein
MPTNLLTTTVMSHDFPHFPDLTLMYTGIRALPNIVNQAFTNFTNVAILRYSGAPDENPSDDPTSDIPTSVLPLNETDLHVGDICLFSHLFS